MRTLRKFILPIAAALALSATFFSFTAGATTQTGIRQPDPHSSTIDLIHPLGATPAGLPAVTERAPECNPLRLITPSGKSIWLQACGSGPGNESQVKDWTPNSLARQTAVMDGVTSLTPANCPRSAPCVLIGQSTPHS